MQYVESPPGRVIDLEAPAGGPSPFYRMAKRAVDIIGAALALIIIAPVWALIALAIKLDSRGPVLVRQDRAGRDGRAFTCYKFRSMVANADPAIHRRYVERFMAENAASEVVNGKAYYKLRNDPRITRVGRILRKTSLDEVPQLLNVLRGEMSLVGPRPALMYEVAQYKPWQCGRLAAKPGITGPWQVYGRSRVPFDEMVRMDIAYAIHPSIRWDLKLIVLTLPAILAGAGAD
jgi:lipopolysaccharide/colanic/teichoic acid biosynthesis glycosyltransferase